MPKIVQKGITISYGPRTDEEADALINRMSGSGPVAFTRPGTAATTASASRPETTGNGR